jgi:hypothetical protein
VLIKPRQARGAPLTAPPAATASNTATESNTNTDTDTNAEADAEADSDADADHVVDGFTVVPPAATYSATEALDDDDFLLVVPAPRPVPTLQALTAALRHDAAAITAPIAASNRAAVAAIALDRERAEAEVMVKARSAGQSSAAASNGSGNGVGVNAAHRVYVRAGVDASMVPARVTTVPIGAVMSDVSDAAIAEAKAEQRRLENEFIAEMRAEYEAYVARVMAEQEQRDKAQAEATTGGDPGLEASLALARQLAVDDGVAAEELNQWQQPGSARERAARERAMRDSIANKLRSLRKRVKRDGVDKVREELAAEKLKAEAEPKEPKAHAPRISASSRFGALMDYDESDSDNDA